MWNKVGVEIGHSLHARMAYDHPILIVWSSAKPTQAHSWLHWHCLYNGLRRREGDRHRSAQVLGREESVEVLVSSVAFSSPVSYQEPNVVGTEDDSDDDEGDDEETVDESDDGQ